jgi:short-subunit dehydrogenase
MMMNADVVAQAGWAGLKQGRRVVIPGFRNRLTKVLGQLMPYRVMLPGIMRTLMARS